jgi:hypothetical protein
MTSPVKILLVVTLVAVIPVSLAGQKKSTARDAFWSAGDLITVTPNPAAHKHPATHSQHGSDTPARSDSGGDSAFNSQPQGTAQATKATQLVTENGYGAAPHLVRASEDRLGLRVSVMRREPSGEYTEVAPDSVFHSGDHIRLSFLANAPGYFYVIEQGSTGAWSPIFPPRNSSIEATKISAGQLQVVPGGTKTFQFDQNPGDEKLFVVLSRTPIADIDRAIENLRGGQPAAPQPTDAAPTLEAENRIPDAFVQQLSSRDLTLVDEEKVGDSPSQANSGEKAIYVVDRMAGPASNSQVVLRLDLKHE